MDNREIYTAACLTQLDWTYYEANKPYPLWWLEMNEEELDVNLYVVASIFTSH